MPRFTFKIVLLIILAFISTSKMLLHHQDTHQSLSTTFVCCPDTYVFDDSTLSCICPPASPYVDASGRCIPCNSPGYFKE